MNTKFIPWSLRFWRWRCNSLRAPRRSSPWTNRAVISGGEWRARWSSLTEEERMKLKAAHQKSMADPAVQAAHDRLKQARREFREVMRPAMLKADPTVQPILDKLRTERAGRE